MGKKTNYLFSNTSWADNGGQTVIPTNKEGDACTFVISTIKIHLSAAGGASENLVISIDSGQGAAYDIVLLTQDMNTVQDLVYQPDFVIPFKIGDEIDVTYANTNSRTIGMEICYREST